MGSPIQGTTGTSGLHWSLLLVPNVLLPNLPQPLECPLTHPLLSGPKFISPPCSPTFARAGSTENGREAKESCGTQPGEAELHPQPPDKEGTVSNERERRNGRAGSLSSWLVPISLPCAHP